MSNSIIVVISTQFRENYGAHDWDGEGYCPQHWKSKGGDTYFINASADDIANTQWWVDVERSIEHSSAYSEEYIAVCFWVSGNGCAFDAFGSSG